MTEQYQVFWRAGARRSMIRLPQRIVFAVTEFVHGRWQARRTGSANRSATYRPR